ncbi:formylglycine-generating enzyme family protein [Brevundimonas diminuta]|uniref:formylglycine-generating enzyme family protein n=1 Tax=Brevundimonas diminuta TaxID=293 RepID=UPI0022AEBD0B|nr:formylglycine-generating enzyme family protein [Brevundimonas diminuta]MCZ4107831.1 formylglycine-generating enzyme family protein [Brevundimonas diminuta]
MTKPPRSKPAHHADHPDMVWVDGGRFHMGSDRHYPEEAPRRPIQVDGFWIDPTPVTNRQFSAFVEATGWVTLAERPADPKDYPGAHPAMLIPASSVFTPTRGPVDLSNHLNWWTYTPSASWRNPLGPDSGLEGLEDHPVVHVALEDVEAYARWVGLDLPTEAEWEYAAWGGREDAEYAWGDELEPDGKHHANVWQGRFPYENTAADGWVRTSPVKAYAPNGFGLYDMIGNVWEWTRDWWSVAATPLAKSCCAPVNPRGGAKSGSGDPLAPRLPRRVMKGGSHLCAPSYCRRYRPAARHPQAVDTSTSHIGFRCVKRAAATG